MANTTFPSDRLKRSSTGTMAKRIDLRCKIVLLGTLFFLVLPGLQGFANPETDNPDFRAGQVETAWSRNGYNIQSEDETLFVVLAFEYQNLVSLVPSQNKLIVFSKLKRKPADIPEKPYRENIEKVMRKSGFDEAYIGDMLKIVESDVFKLSTEYTISGDRFSISPYKNTNLVLELIFSPDVDETQKTVDPTKDDDADELKKRIGILEERNKELLTELSSALENCKARERRINRLLDEIETLEARLEKYRGLAEFRAGIVDNQKKVIDRYQQIFETNRQTLDDQKDEIASINMKHVTDLEEKQKALDKQARENKDLRDALKSSKNEIELMNHEIQTLNTRIGELKEMFSKRENFLISEINTLKSRLMKAEKPAVEATGTYTPIPIKEQQEATETRIVSVKEEDKDEKSASKTSDTKEDIKPDKMEPEEEVESVEPAEEKKRLKRIKALREDRELYTIDYRYNDDGLPVEENVVLPNGNTAERTVSQYNEDGKLEEQMIYRDGSLVTRNQFKRDEAGRLIRILSYSADNEITGYQLLEYNNAKSEKEPANIKRYENTVLKTRTENRFDSEGRIIETRTYNSDGELIARSAVTFENGQPKKTTYYENGEIAAYNIVEYDENSRPVSQNTYNQNAILMNKLIFEYQ